MNEKEETWNKAGRMATERRYFLQGKVRQRAYKTAIR
jgi:hypothetical protein